MNDVDIEDLKREAVVLAKASEAAESLFRQTVNVECLDGATRDALYAALRSVR